MDDKPRQKRKPKKIYKTVIRFSPPKPGTTGSREPEIEIDTITLRPKLIRPKLKARAAERRAKALPPSPGALPFKIAERFDEELIQKKEWIPVTNRTRWKCVRCGWCCTHEWRVNLTWDEYDRLREKIPIAEVVVDPQTGMSHPLFTIKDKCPQYDPKSHKCKIYKERAYSCATFPFALTPEGKLVRSKFCRGFGKGKRIDPRKMVTYIKKWRKRAGMKI